jgi:hypothetical protein
MARTPTALRMLCAATAVLACVPEGPPTSSEPPPKPAASAAERPKRADKRGHKPDALLAAPFRDDFERAKLGEGWLALSGNWRIEAGELCGEEALNRGVWLRRRLPDNARIEFEARAVSPEGDIKAEAWGDGESGASGSSYDDATSYLFVFGGWKNSLHVLARLDEHGADRQLLEVDPSSDDPRQRPLEEGQVYRFRIERRDRKTVTWWIDDMLMHELEDPEPLLGTGHDHFGFNDWKARVCFDNLLITPL